MDLRRPFDFWSKLQKEFQVRFRFAFALRCLIYKVQSFVLFRRENTRFARFFSVEQLT